MDMTNRTIGSLAPDTILTQSGLSLMQGIIDGRQPVPPFAPHTNIWLTEAEPGRAVFEGDTSVDFLNPQGTVHGGWTATIMDSALGSAVQTLVAAGETFTTVEMKVHYVRALKANSGRVRCEGKVVHKGGRIATSEARLTDAEGRLIAHGTETCMIMPLKPAG